MGNRSPQLTRDREVGEAISEGINMVATMLAVLHSGDLAGQPPSPEWRPLVEAMARALDAVVAKEVTTSVVVTPGDIEHVRKLGLLLSTWTSLGHPPEELAPVAGSVLALFGLPGSRSAQSAI